MNIRTAQAQDATRIEELYGSAFPDEDLVPLVRDLLPPYPLPPEWRAAWQSVCLHPGRSLAGSLRVPAPWHRPELWA